MAQIKETMGQVLSSVGLLLAAVTCGIPMWHSVFFLGCSVTGLRQVIWEGLWMDCLIENEVLKLCKLKNLEMSSLYVQAARVMTVISILLGVVGIVLPIAGRKCPSKSKAFIAAGVLFIASGLLCCVSVSWCAVTVMDKIYLQMRGIKYEIGAALYIGWAATALLLVGGGALCSNCPPKNKPQFTRMAPASTSRESIRCSPASEGTLSEKYELI
ncbi:claudin-4-like [Kryptolebias marmoratus]|uniref:claudin-4-like n=1 Tax=Kryptolebias marmoratus TaxID=37003 RepID=UPI0007F8E0EB|nr:claudin-4-like [Kryptolebias marmoratus]